MSDQASIFSTVTDTSSSPEEIAFPVKGAASPTPNPVSLVPADSTSKSADLEVLEPLTLAPPSAIAEEAEDRLPQSFWSLLTPAELREYTWFGPWAPSGAAYTAPDLALVGTAGKDFITGTAQAEALYGVEGRDLLLGEEGNDLIIGGADIDALLGGPGSDVLLGSEGDDRLDGGSGKDWLNGGPGRNIVTGGRGLDVFAFFVGQPRDLSAVPLELGNQLFDAAASSGSGNASASGPDTVTDFTPGEDLILIGGLLTEPLPEEANPFTDYVDLSKLGTSTVVSIHQRNPLGELVTTEIAVLNNVLPTELSASSFVFG